MMAVITLATAIGFACGFAARCVTGRAPPPLAPLERRPLRLADAEPPLDLFLFDGLCGFPGYER